MKKRKNFNYAVKYGKVEENIIKNEEAEIENENG